MYSEANNNLAEKKRMKQMFKPTQAICNLLEWKTEDYKQ